MFCCHWDSMHWFLVPELDKELGPKHQLSFLRCFKLIFLFYKCSRKNWRVKKTVTIVLMLEGTICGSFENYWDSTVFSTMTCWQYTLVCMHVISLERRREETPRCKSNRSRKMERPKGTSSCLFHFPTEDVRGTLEFQQSIQSLM